jgi:hypothetical protein
LILSKESGKKGQHDNSGYCIVRFETQETGGTLNNQDYCTIRNISFKPGLSVDKSGSKAVPFTMMHVALHDVTQTVGILSSYY